MRPELQLVPDPAPTSAPGDGFAEAMSTLASGVVIVTCTADGRPWGMTVTAFTSVSADPPTVLVSLDSAGTSASAIAASGRFGVSVLAANHVALARYGSFPGASKFLEAFVNPGEAGSSSPAIAGALAHLDCEVRDTVRVADHTIFFGLARAALAAREGTPLLYHRRAYRTLDAPHAERSDRCLSS
jgi:flavin reductase (DIM6/NTAB) family NADH-FMN oxidoreductase RutF